MDPDKYLVRDNTDSGMVNLALGEPFFLRRHLEPLLEDVVHSDVAVSEPFFGYPPQTGHGGLLEELSWMFPGKYVVVANGAKQAIGAAFYAFREAGKSAVFHEAPHWPTYPSLAKLARMSFFSSRWEMLCLKDEAVKKHFVTVRTAPNNPDGRMVEALDLGFYDIWDAAYAHPVYGWQPHEVPYHMVSIWSGAKLFGMSGDRIGWLVTGVKEVAELAADYVEKTTSGVNLRSQHIMANVLEMVREYKSQASLAYEDARRCLLLNAEAFNDFLAHWCSDVAGLPNNKRGMFACFRIREDLRGGKFDAILNEQKMLLVPGTAFGITEAGWYRMSLGHYSEVTEKALGHLDSAIFKALHG